MSEAYIYDWNQQDILQPPVPTNIELCDETLRDGIQSPSVYDPDLENKYKLLVLMDQLGITIANIGLPGAGPRAYEDCLNLARFAQKNKLKIKLNCAARTLIQDIEPIARIQEKVGIAITAYCFLGTSPVRQLVENWDIKILSQTTNKALKFAQEQNLKFGYVTEDTTRSNPETLKILFSEALELGCERLVLCDTVGHATPNGVKKLVNFSKQIIKNNKPDTYLDWHGHNDRGLGLVNALFAAQYGCHRIHGTALGVGERVGNTPIDQLIINLKLLGSYNHDVSKLVSYVECAAKACKIPIAYNYPLAGSDAFRTATGVHAAAVIKALQKYDQNLADIIYSSVPAHWFGKEQTIEIGPMSGASNIRFWLQKHKIKPTEILVGSILKYAKTKTRVLKDLEIKEFINAQAKENSLPL